MKLVTEEAQTKMENDFEGLNPGDILADHKRRFLDSTFPFDRKRVADQDVERFVAEGQALLKALDYSRLPDLVDRLWKRHFELMDPRPKTGEPQPVTPRSEIERNIGVFQKWQYRGRQTDACEAWLVPGERIVVGPFDVTTDKNRKISRDELKAACRMVGETSTEKFDARFINNRAVDELMREEEQRKQNADRPPHWDSYNRDLSRDIQS
jgi:hypothetical protein